MEYCVTVTFVAWMRRELLAKGIESALAMRHPRLELLVADNSPSDEIFQWIRTAYPMVKCVKTLRPLPLPLVRNLLVASASGKYVIFLDDDSRFSKDCGLDQAIEYLEVHPNVACLAFRQGNEKGEWNPLFDGPVVRPTYNYIACAAMFRRSDYLLAGGYFEHFPLYGEELILSLGLFGLGKEIHYFPGVPIIHEQISLGRSRDPGKRYHLADIVMTPGAFLLRAPIPDVVVWYPVALVWSIVKIAVFRRRPLVALRGLVTAMTWIPSFVKERRTISRADFHRWQRTRRASAQDVRARTATSR